MGFLTSLKEAQVYEKRFVLLLRNSGVPANLNTASTLKGRQGFDVLTSKGLLELKIDFASERTGNFCLEEPTLLHTISDFLVIGEPESTQFHSGTDRQFHFWFLHINQAWKLYMQYPAIKGGDRNYNLVNIQKDIIKRQSQSLQQWLRN